ncbi:MAP3K12-binding inhibitory protein 1-like [Diadema antillarum]|uniref:MAP3K12-binding inhibitory protein 1-like n=1 Tax=Diadema antillarum TaxID=105358 RepID=UPI003A88E76D
MDASAFIDKFAKCFQDFMTEVQLSSAVSMVIDESVLSEVNVKLPILKNGLSLLIQDLQNLCDQCNSSASTDESKLGGNQSWSCKQKDDDDDVKPGGAFDPSVVQITVDNKEIDRRILAFIEKKQAEKDDTNRREFCPTVSPSPETSCARTNAVFTSKMGGASHVKVSKVVNKYGPQTRPGLVSIPLARPGIKRTRTLPDSTTCSTNSVSGIEERLHNMESFLGLQAVHENLSSDVFKRLKVLEERLLHLEGISPEYCHISSSMSKQSRVGPGMKPPGDSAVQDIDNRIKMLQRSLRLRKAQMEGKSGKSDTG